MQPISKPVSAGGSSSGATSVVTNNQVKGESVSSSSEITPEVTEVSSGILKNKETVVPILPDSTNSKAKTPQLVAYHGGSSAESSTDSSEDSESEEDAKKTTKRGKDQEPDDLDLDDIDKALEMALEKKKVCFILKDPQKTPYGYLDCGLGLVRVTVIYLEYTRPRVQARVYTFDIHRKSPRSEEYMWKLNVTLVKDYLKSLK